MKDIYMIPSVDSYIFNSQFLKFVIMFLCALFIGYSYSSYTSGINNVCDFVLVISTHKENHVF